MPYTPPSAKRERTKPGKFSESCGMETRVAVLSSWGPGGALRRRCLPHTGTLRAWAPRQRDCPCALSSQGPRSPGHRQVLRSTWRPCLPLCSARHIPSAGGAARVLPDARQLRDQPARELTPVPAQGRGPEGHRRAPHLR